MGGHVSPLTQARSQVELPYKGVTPFTIPTGLLSYATDQDHGSIDLKADVYLAGVFSHSRNSEDEKSRREDDPQYVSLLLQAGAGVH
jgi:hypothetical protein